MYISPFWAGVAALFIAEVAAVLIAAAVVAIKQNKKK